MLNGDVFNEISNLCDFESFINLSTTCKLYWQFSKIKDVEDYINNNFDKPIVLNFLRKEYTIILNRINIYINEVMESYILINKVQTREEIKEKSIHNTIFSKINIDENISMILNYCGEFIRSGNNIGPIFLYDISNEGMTEYEKTMDKMNIYDMIYYINIILYYIPDIK
mgnify:CR=1 FL=1